MSSTGRRRGGQSQDGRLGHIRSNVGNLQIGRTEVVAPLRDAVRLVDGQQADFHSAQGLDKLVGLKTFRRDIEEFQTAVCRLVISQFQLIGVHAGIDGRRRDAFLHKMRHLVLHQRDEGRDDEAETVHSLSGHYRVDDILLQWAETGIVPILLQYGSGLDTHSINSITRVALATPTSHP